MTIKKQNLPPKQRIRKTIYLLGAGLTGLCMMAATTSAWANPVQFNGNGHYYEFVHDYNINWNAAKLAAEQRSHLGVQGHLATVANEDEDIFLHQQFSAAILAVWTDGAPQAWLGGSSATRSTDKTGDWAWVTGEPWSYPGGWSTNEPNDGFDPTVASAAQMDLRTNLDGWNDSPVNFGGIEGYIVEYGTDQTSVMSGGQPNQAHPSLQLWLDASELPANTTSVSTWPDLTTHGRDVNQASSGSQPTYNASSPLFANLPTVHFDGNDVLQTSDFASAMNITGNSARTIFFVFSQDNGSNSNILGYGVNGGLQIFDIAAAGQKISGHFYSTPFVNGTQMFELNQMTVGSVTYDGTAYKAFQHDVCFSGQTTNAAYALNTHNSVFNVGRGVYAQYNSFVGNIAEILVYSENLSELDRTAVDNYLFDKYAGASCGSSLIANAGTDFSVNEGQTGVMLDGSGSIDTDNDPLTYAWGQLAGTGVMLSNTSAQQPTFDAPLVAIGGETLTFELTVTANGEENADTVDVTVVNVNHPPVADAGDDQSIAEGSPVTLHGEDSFDVDNDSFSYSWVQTGGSPTVALTGAGMSNPTFNAPVISTGGAPGVVATLVFELTVDDGFSPDVPAPGYTLPTDVDSVTVEITNVNNDPIADAGGDQTVDENTAVTLNGGGSSDPDNDLLTYSWSQTSGPTVVGLTGDTNSSPSFMVPFVSSGGADIEFELTVNDGYGGFATDSVVVHVQNANDPPLVSAAEPTIDALWPPNHKLVSIGITGVSDPDDNATIVIYAVTQDEPTNGQGDGDTEIDAIISDDGSTVLLRAERVGGDNGRVYHIHFTASDLEGSASGTVSVSVPHKKKSVAIDDGELYNSTQ